MLKKIVLGALLAGLIVILVAGGIIRTADKTENVAEAREASEGRGNAYGAALENQEEDCDSEEHGQGKGAQEAAGRSGQGQSGSGQGAGQGQGAGGAERQYPNNQASSEPSATYEGTVVESPTDGGELVIETDDGQQITVGTGPGYMQTQGFSLEAGETVRVQGYWEDDELKAAQVTRLRDGQTITLRDQSGRPAWAGSGKNRTEQQATAPQGDQGQGQGGQSSNAGQGQGQGGQGNGAGQGRESAPGDGTGTGEAEVDEWLTISGTALSTDSSALIVQAADGKEITVEGRAWRFALEQGFSAQAGDALTLTGFYENDDFEVGKIANDSTGQTVQIREENGRPLWAGRGRRGG